MKAIAMFIDMKGLRIHARHGVDQQERRVGADFLIDLRLKTDFARAAQIDELDGTIDYATVYEAVTDEMRTPSKLLENVCERIAARLFATFERVEEIELRLLKENPPMGADCREAGVEVRYIR